MYFYLPLQIRFEVLVGAGRNVSQSFITRAKKYKNRRRIKMSLLASWSSPGSRASCWEMVERMKILLTQLVSKLSLLAHTLPNRLTTPVCWDPPLSLLSHSCPDPEGQEGNPQMVSSHVQLSGDTGRSAAHISAGFPQISYGCLCFFSFIGVLRKIGNILTCLLTGSPGWGPWASRHLSKSPLAGSAFQLSLLSSQQPREASPGRGPGCVPGSTA